MVPTPSRFRRRHDGRSIVGRIVQVVMKGLTEVGVRANIVGVSRTGSARDSGFRGRRRKMSFTRAHHEFRMELNCMVANDVPVSGVTPAEYARALEKAGVKVVFIAAPVAAADPRNQRVDVI